VRFLGLTLPLVWFGRTGLGYHQYTDRPVPWLRFGSYSARRRGNPGSKDLLFTPSW